MKDTGKVWTKIFGIKVGDFIRFKYGKVVWEVYHEGNFLLDRGSWKGTRHYWKLKRYRRSRDRYHVSWRDTIYRTLWDFELRTKEITKVEKKRS